ncbi:MAG: argininosuccinate lyase, partial [Hyphomicrobiales bacterium]|nr:argininosuccinate lyase [Hyphomicrobiales bacterium]
TGRIVALAASHGVGLEQLSLDDLRAIDPAFEQDALDVLAVEKSVASRTSFGGTAPRSVETQAEAWLARLRGERHG